MSDRDCPPCGLPDVAGAPVLVVMAKPLVAGHVKSRLAATIGDDEALAVYERLLSSTLARAEHVAGVRLCWPSRRGMPRGRPTVRAGPREQRGETLAERLAAVFDDLFAGGARAVVAVGSDSPAIPAEYLELAFARLAPGRIVLGPAADGGYYALGVDRATWSSRAGTARVLVADAPMGESSLLSWTLSEATRRGLEAAQLPLWLDVDEAADLPVFERLSADSGLRGEATRRARPARGLPARDEPLRQRLPALLQPRQPPGAGRA